MIDNAQIIMDIKKFSFVCFIWVNPIFNTVFLFKKYMFKIVNNYSNIMRRCSTNTITLTIKNIDVFEGALLPALSIGETLL